MHEEVFEIKYGYFRRPLAVFCRLSDSLVYSSIGIRVFSEPYGRPYWSNLPHCIFSLHLFTMRDLPVRTVRMVTLQMPLIMCSKCLDLLWRVIFTLIASEILTVILICLSHSMFRLKKLLKASMRDIPNFLGELLQSGIFISCVF